MTIKDKAFRNAMKEAGLEKVQLEKGNGYFYIWSDDEELGVQLAGLYDNCILCNSFKDQSIEAWIKDIQNLMNEASYDDVSAPVPFEYGE